jgi:hypothetical protein
MFLFRWLKSTYHRIKNHIRYKRRLRELKKRDPFIY